MRQQEGGGGTVLRRWRAEPGGADDPMPGRGTPSFDRRCFLGTAPARRVGFRLGKDTTDITLDGNTVEGFATRVDDRRK